MVCIGASAGSLEAITELLTHIPADPGMAFKFVRYLSPDHESILARSTKMIVLEAKNLMKIEADHFYMIPPDKQKHAIDYPVIWRVF